ncbi:MAG: DUF4105 domain-containing protein [Burkholderiaceae bacterium]
MVLRAAFALYLLLLGASLCATARANPYLDELIAAARVHRLSQRQEWLTLLHYQPRFRMFGLRSLADSADFFNAPDGATDAQSELEATLAAFFSDAIETDTSQNPQCRFIARYTWLKQELGFDAARLREQPCLRFRNWRADLDPQGVALVFPAAYLNNPASMYGHTLLRIDGRGHDARSRLLAHAINYAAGTDETSGLVFAVRGLFGAYPGNFNIAPYYAKVEEYNDLENRDMWEYELNLAPAEIELLLMHAWELGPTRFDYYFLDENCSYHLLSLLDAARPGLRLIDQFPLWAIPGDTVRAVTERSGLVRRVIYRPARSTQLRHRQALLGAHGIDLARRLAAGEFPPDDARLEALSSAHRAQVTDLAFEYLEYSRLRGDVDNRDSAPRLRALLAARSRIDAADVPEVPVPALRPEHGHRSGRVGLGLGTREGKAFQELRLRPAYHDLLDPEEGYTRGAQLEFTNFVLRRNSEDASVRLETLNLIDVVSLTPQDELLRPRSWRFNIGARRSDQRDGTRPLVANLDGGAGRTVELHKRMLGYALAEGALLGSRSLERSYAAGAGGSAGMIVDATSRWRVHAHARSLRFFAGQQHSTIEAGLDQRFTLTRDAALRLEASWRRADAASWKSATFYLDCYF